MLFTTSVCTTFALVCSVRYVKLLTGYGWGSSDWMKSSLLSLLFVYLYLMCNVSACSVNQTKIMF